MEREGPRATSVYPLFGCHRCQTGRSCRGARCAALFQPTHYANLMKPRTFWKTEEYCVYGWKFADQADFGGCSTLPACLLSTGSYIRSQLETLNCSTQVNSLMKGSQTGGPRATRGPQVNIYGLNIFCLFTLLCICFASFMLELHFLLSLDLVVRKVLRNSC